MKVYNIVILYFLLLCFQSNQEVTAQEYNPSLQNATVRLSHDGVTGEGYFDFILENQSFSYNERSRLSFTVCLLNARLNDGINSISSLYKDDFEWLFDPHTNCFMARQNSDLQREVLMSFGMDLVATRLVGCEEGSKIGFNANIQPAAIMNNSNVVEDDHVSDYTCQIFTDIEELTKGDYKIFPNPTSELLHVIFSEKITGRVELFNVKGQLVKDLSFDAHDRVILKVRDLPEGSYMVKLTHPDKTYFEKINIMVR